MLPQLPSDVWYRISRFCSPETLSALAEVSKTFNKLATHQTHFTRQISLPNLHPKQAYRREACLQHPPTNFSTTPKPITRIYKANDTALLLDTRNNSLIAFPTGYNFPLSHPDVPAWHVPMLDEIIAFVVASGKKLCMLDLATGDITRVPLLTPKTPRKKDCTVGLAGWHGEWLVQATKDKFVLCDRKTGETIQMVDKPEGANVIPVIGELATAHDGTCVGYAVSTDDRGVRTVRVQGFDGVNTQFQVGEEDIPQRVLRSEDRLTHVLIARRENEYPKYFLASRGSMVWYGSLNDMYYPMLAGNGTLIAESKRFTPELRARGSADSTVCVLLNGTGKEASIQRVYVKRVKRIVWMRRIRGCVFTLVIGRGKDKLHLVKVSYEKGCVTEKVLKDWVIPGVTKVHVIADHYILATSRSKKLHLLHFDRFCNGVGGVFACPLVGLSTYCYFPDQFRGGDDLSRAGKRRRVDGGSDDEVKWS